MPQSRAYNHSNYYPPPYNGSAGGYQLYPMNPENNNVESPYSFWSGVKTTGGIMKIFISAGRLAMAIFDAVS
ncbi:unnamed protein product [Adineta ricciae]|uniref:Uncharacterized protein n=1 Tax=Adineta ricciae TaxID=249248 RepID=A0A816G531_ADIRI|nr:unnamed protein product [Adineta ricciae]